MAYSIFVFVIAAALCDQVMLVKLSRVTYSSQ